jgi:hypothetical protein
MNDGNTNFACFQRTMSIITSQLLSCSLLALLVAGLPRASFWQRSAQYGIASKLGRPRARLVRRKAATEAGQAIRRGHEVLISLPARHW